MYPYRWPKGASKVGYLSVDQVRERLQVKEDMSFVTGMFDVQYSVALQRGYYREHFVQHVLLLCIWQFSYCIISAVQISASDLNKPCQDSFLEGIFGGVQWLCVFDGHGSTGHTCANYTRDNLILNYKADILPCKGALGTALLGVNTR